MTTINGAPNTGSNEDDDIVEITLDIRDDDTVGFHVTSSHQEVATRLATTMQNRSSSSTTRPERTQPASACALNGLRFVIDIKGDGSWHAVEKRFDDLTSRTEGLLHRKLFGECIGMDKQSEKFGVALVDALCRRRHIPESSRFINKAELREFLDQISDQSFNSRLHTFIDMVDKDGDGRVTEEEVKEIISVSASANKLTKVESYSEEYAALIMEEFDPDNFGYIMIHDLEMLLVEACNDGSSIRSGREISRSCSSEMLNPSGEEAAGNNYWWRSSYKRYLRLITLRSSIKPVKILKVTMYPGNVLALHMTKPLGFKYKSGQYMFINCSDVSCSEWRPFYITSAQGDDYLSVHIQILGDWTQQLNTVFSLVCQSSVEADLMRWINATLPTTAKPDFPQVSIDGPYEASTQNYKKYEVVLLVGIGIGIAPMISVVKDIVNNIKATGGEVDEALEGSSTRSNPTESNSKKKGFKTKRAYFYWVTEEQGSFQWFKGVMNEVAEMDQKDVIEIHNYCTSVYEEGDARSVFISLLQRLKHAKNCIDIVSGTRVMSHFAKPNWYDMYQRIALNHGNSHVGVFCCGPQTLTKELGQLALDFSGKTSTKFDFHKDYF